MKRRAKPPAKSLYTTVPGKRVPFTIENLRRLSDPTRLCDAALDRIRESARTAASETIERADWYAKELRQRLVFVDAARKAKHVDSAIFEALKLAEAWGNFRADVFFSDLVRAREASTIAHRGNMGAVNLARAADADMKVLRDFNQWQRKVRSQLMHADEPPPADERVRKYLRAVHIPDRQKRRLRALLKAGKIPSLQK